MAKSLMPLLVVVFFVTVFSGVFLWENTRLGKEALGSLNEDKQVPDLGAKLSDAAASEARQKVHRTLHKDTGVGSHETLLTFFLSSMLKEDEGELLPEGGILDCGAQFGEQGAHYAVSAPKRKVIAMDPSPRNVQRMKKDWGSLENIEVRQGGLGREVGTMKPRDKSFEMDLNGEFPVYTLDSMYFDKQDKLAFAHLDLEGMEFDAIQGGLKTIRSNKPVFTVELRVHDTNNTKRLLDLIDSERYDTYVIDEPCGWPHSDFRNVLCIPRSRSVAFGKSNSFNLLLAMEGLKRVTSDDIAQKILPCCSLGGECCPGNSLSSKQCCTEKKVLDWHEKHKEAHQVPVSMLGFRSGRREYFARQWRLRQREKTP